MGIDESPFDIDSEIKFIRKVNPTLNLTNRGASSLLANKELTEDDSNLESMSDDEIESVFRFEADIDDVEDNHSEHKEELSKIDKAVVDNMIDELVDMDHSKDASADKPAKMLELLSDTLKNILPWIIKDSVKKTLPKLNKRVKKTLKAQVHEIVLKPLYKEFNDLNKMESTRWNAKNQLDCLIDPVLVSPKAATEGEKVTTQKQTDHVMEHELTVEAQMEQSSKQAPPISTALLIQSSEEPPTKKLEFVLEDFPFLPQLSCTQSDHLSSSITSLMINSLLTCSALDPMINPPKVADKTI
ncbi:hypothetical protein Tco_1462660 [Tanacetum coccineum]